MISSLEEEANEFAAPPAAIDCYKPLYDMHLSSQSHSADCYPLGSITIDFEGAWAQKWAQLNDIEIGLRSRLGIARIADPRPGARSSISQPWLRNVADLRIRVA